MHSTSHSTPHSIGSHIVHGQSSKNSMERMVQVFNVALLHYPICLPGTSFICLSLVSHPATHVSLFCTAAIRNSQQSRIHDLIFWRTSVFQWLLILCTKTTALSCVEAGQGNPLPIG